MFFPLLYIQCHDTPTSSCSTTTGTTPPPFTMETIIVIASVGGGLALLVCFLLFVLLITCCCLRKPDRSKASLRTFKGVCFWQSLNFYHAYNHTSLTS